MAQGRDGSCTEQELGCEAHNALVPGLESCIRQASGCGWWWTI